MITNKFSPVDHLIINSYKSIMDGMSEYFGPGYEMVLHSLEDYDHSAIKVINGHYTGRKEGAPITDMALEMLAEIRRSSDAKKNMIYFNHNKNGVPIRSATLPITGENERIIGLLCMNFYMDIPLHSFLDGIFKINGNNKEVSETFSSNPDQLILSSCEAAKAKVMNDSSISTANKNKEIIVELQHKEIFSLKNAVIKVAEYLGISKNTVYLHLRNMQDAEEGQ